MITWVWWLSRFLSLLIIIIIITEVKPKLLKLTFVCFLTCMVSNHLFLKTALHSEHWKMVAPLLSVIDLIKPSSSARVTSDPLFGRPTRRRRCTRLPSLFLSLWKAGSLLSLNSSFLSHFCFLNIDIPNKLPIWLIFNFSSAVQFPPWPVTNKTN